MFGEGWLRRLQVAWTSGALQGHNPAPSTLPTPPNQWRGVCKIPAAASLGFPSLVCWVSTSPLARLPRSGSCMPGMSSTCRGGICGSRRAPLSPALLLLRELSGQLVTQVGDVNRPDVTTKQPLPGKRCSESLWLSYFSWLPGWAATAPPCHPCSPGMGWHCDSTESAEPGPHAPTPVPSPAWHWRDTVTAPFITAEALTRTMGQLQAL